MSTASGIVSQTDLVGANLLYTDTGAYGAVSSRTLSVFNANGVIIGLPYNMGADLTQAVVVAKDGYLQFICVVVDNTGTYSAQVIYDTNGFFAAQSLAVLASIGCDCESDSIFDNLIRGEIYQTNSQTYALVALGPQTQAAMDAANLWVNNPY